MFILSRRHHLHRDATTSICKRLRGGTWSRELFVINRQISMKPVTFKLINADSDSIKGAFYEPELQKVQKPDEDALFAIEKVLRMRRQKDGMVEHSVKWPDIRENSTRGLRIAATTIFNSSNHFHLTLPSSASMNIYPKDTASQCMTKLPKQIELMEGDWNVSLKEVLMPISFVNVQSKQYTFQVKSITEHLELLLPSGVYRSTLTMIQNLNRLAGPHNISCRFVGEKTIEGHKSRSAICTLYD